MTSPPSDPAGEPAFPPGFGHFDGATAPPSDPAGWSAPARGWGPPPRTPAPAGDPPDSAEPTTSPGQATNPGPTTAAGPTTSAGPTTGGPAGTWRPPSRSGRSAGIVVLLSLLLIVPVMLSGWWAVRVNAENRGDSGFGGAQFPEFGANHEPLDTGELYSRESYTYRVTLTDRVLEGELNRIDAYDHPDCASAALDQATEVATALADCLSRIEAVYQDPAEDLWVSQQVLMFPDEAAAAAFAGLLADDFAGHWLAFAFHSPDDLQEAGYAGTRVGQRDHYVVVTLAVSAVDDDDLLDALRDHSHVRHAETMSYLIWR